MQRVSAETLENGKAQHNESGRSSLLEKIYLEKYAVV
jgi:hypothetical protein